MYNDSYVWYARILCHYERSRAHNRRHYLSTRRRYRLNRCCEFWFESRVLHHRYRESTGHRYISTPATIDSPEKRASNYCNLRWASTLMARQDFSSVCQKLAKTHLHHKTSKKNKENYVGCRNAQRDAKYSLCRSVLQVDKCA